MKINAIPYLADFESYIIYEADNNMESNFIKCGHTVLVKNDDHEQLSVIRTTCGDNVIVESLDYPYKTSKVNAANVFETVPAPIDEKNIISDWIDGELLDDCSQHGREYLGWINERPVYAKVQNDGKLMVKMVDGSSIQPTITAIQKLFDANPDNDNIYIHFQTAYGAVGNWVKVAFYFSLSHNQ